MELNRSDKSTTLSDLTALAVIIMLLLFIGFAPQSIAHWHENNPSHRYHPISHSGFVSARQSVQVSSMKDDRVYLLPRNAHTPQFPELMSPGSRSFRSHRKLRNRFSPASINKSTSPAIFSSTHFLSRCMSQSVYPVEMMGTLVSRSCGNVSSHSCALAGCPSPG